MMRPINETKNMLFSIAKNYETLVKQTHTKPPETSEIKLTKPRKLSHLNHQLFLVLILNG